MEFADVAREAYVTGWAATGGPMTDRVRAGADAAVAMACEHHTEHGVLEATIQLGELEGTWAAVYERREKLYAEHITLVTAAWRDLVATLDIGGAVLAFRRQLGLASETTQDEEERDRHRKEAAAAALLLLFGLFRDKHDPRYVTLVGLLSEAIRVGNAEGVAGALAIAAQQVGKVGVDFDAVFQDALDAPGRADTFAPEADGWIVRIAQGSATDVGNLLAALADEGASYDDMVAAIAGLLGADDQRAAATIVDVAMGTAFSRAAIGYYRRAGAGAVDFVTAGGSKVCAICLAEEAANPHTLDEVKPPPLHPFCRCVLIPSTPITTLIVEPQYLPGGA